MSDRWESYTKTNKYKSRKTNAKRKQRQRQQLKRSAVRTARAIKLNELGFSNYNDYLVSDIWINRREEYEKNHLKECYCCGSDGKIILHHTSYANVGKELDSDLVWLCQNCHEGVHKSIKWDLGAKLANAHMHYKNNPQRNSVLSFASDREPTTLTVLQQKRADELKAKLAQKKRDDVWQEIVEMMDEWPDKVQKTKQKKVPKSDRDVPTPRKVVTVTLQQDRIDELKRLAQLESDEQCNVSYSDLIRKAIDCYLGHAGFKSLRGSWHKKGPANCRASKGP